MGRRSFAAILIKPSHYDANGYVIQWRRSSIPSNSLASLYGLLKECRQDKCLGPDVDIEVDALDECNRIVDLKETIRKVESAGSGFVGLVGVQSNQFPRALDMARELRAAGLCVVIGGFHVSGCLAMLPELPPSLQEALDPDAKTYMDRALAPVPNDPVKDHLVELFADKLPKTYGAPLREPVAM